MQADNSELKSLLVRYYGDQKRAARAFGVSPVTLCRIVTGKRKATPVELEYISRALAKKLFQIDEEHKRSRAGGYKL
jgi:DNA-binding transcriptional regulator YdaS (Cro superfamily)